MSEPDNRRKISVTVDRPLGSRHPQHPDIVYGVNYGYVPGLPGGDGEEQDVYILGVDHPVESFEGRLAARIIRENDVEEKWVAVPEGVYPTAEEIAAATWFVERYFRARVELM